MSPRQQRTALAAAVALLLLAGPAPARQPAAHSSQAAYRAADAAYKAYERRDYAAAVERAERAVQLAPARRDYRLLLAGSLIAVNRLDEAERALAQAAQVDGDAAALQRAQADLGRARAQAAGASMYQALSAQEFDAAIGHGRRAIELAPENPAYRLALLQALLRRAQYAEAERLAGETLALLPDSAVPLALRGYARQALGRGPEAAADLDRAMAQRELKPAARRELRLLAADLALARGDTAAAQQLLAALPAGDAAAEARRAWLPAVTPAATFVVPAPTVDCSDVAAARTCALLAGTLVAQPGHASATEAYRLMQERDYARALQQARLAAAAAPLRLEWQLLHLNAAQAAGELQEAERAASAALALGVDASVLAQRSSIRRNLGNVAGANEDAEGALRAGGLPPATEAGLLADLGRQGEARERAAAAAAAAGAPAQRVDLAYLSSRIGDDRAALAAFQAADAAGALPVTSLLDAGYAATRAMEDEQAVGYFRRAIDAANGMQLKLDRQMLFDTRRMVAEISRKWGVLASLTSRKAGGATPGFGVTSGNPSGRVLQAGVEAYVRPWGFRNGRFVELFARGFGTLDASNGSNTGGDSFQGALGARWKPLTAHNLVVSGSRVFGPEVNGDWLLQLGYSLDLGTDLRVDVPSWWTTRISAEVGRYLEASQNYGIASLMIGRSYVVSADGRTVLFPHGVVAAEYNSDTAPKSSVGAGPGVSLRRWFREDTYNAPRSYWDVTVQYRGRVSGDDRTQGLYFNTLLSY